MKKDHYFGTCEEAMEFLVENCSALELDSTETVGFLLEEFIRENEFDQGWLNTVINYIGFDNVFVKEWFYEQEFNGSFWSWDSYNIIRKFADTYRSMSDSY